MIVCSCKDEPIPGGTRGVGVVPTLRKIFQTTVFVTGWSQALDSLTDSRLDVLMTTNTVVFSTVTPAPVDRGHRVVVEMEYDTGYRVWSGTMWESSIEDYVRSFGDIAQLSDVDHGRGCPCGSEGWPQD
jgi:hypothetical protein